ncbi:MAG: DUF481 domain-containing protein [Oligoflexia bacterium]|nr:DUF481 domain-containing protein [Oligoflexia bacterium]
MKGEKSFATKINLGAGYAKGNTDFIQFDLDSLTFLNFKKYSVYFDGGVSYRESNREKVSNAASLTSRLDYHLIGRWSVIYINTIGHNEFTRVNFRLNNGAGFLYDYKNEKIRNGVSLVADYNWENNIDYPAIKETLLSFRDEFYYKVHDYVNFYCDFFYIPVINHFKNFVIKLKPKLESKLTENFSFFMTIRIVHDSAPLPGVKLNDVLLSSGFTLDL